MAECIDKEAFLKGIKERYCLPCKGAGKDHDGCKCRACWVDDICGDVIDAPAADVAPVVHGRWVFETATANTLSRIKCDICGWWTLDPSVDNSYKYCPNCGARMDGDKNATD